MTITRGRTGVTRRVAAVLVAGGMFAACAAPGTSAPGSTTAQTTTLRLGYFPNVTHAPAIVGIEKGIFAEKLGSSVALQPATFTAGPAAVEAILSGALDATYIGPNPAINAFAKSKGEAIRIIAGSTTGGAFLVVREGIETPADLRGKTLATPQLGNTQDIALRTWLADQGYQTTLEGGGDVSITPQDNAQTLETFKAGQIDGGWVPEPWASRLILEAGAHVLVDERDLWPEGQYVTTHLVVRTEFLQQHPDVVQRLLDGHIAAVELLSADPAGARALTNQGLERVTGKKLADEVLEASWKNLSFTVDPAASSLKGSAEHAVAAGLLDPLDLRGIYDLALVNGLLVARGEAAVAGL
jgi:NitT/TauT family transport system substrate-binding protein